MGEGDATKVSSADSSVAAGVLVVDGTGDGVCAVAGAGVCIAGGGGGGGAYTACCLCPQPDTRTSPEKPAHTISFLISSPDDPPAFAVAPPRSAKPPTNSASPSAQLRH